MKTFIFLALVTPSFAINNMNKDKKVPGVTFLQTESMTTSVDGWDDTYLS